MNRSPLFEPESLNKIEDYVLNVLFTILIAKHWQARDALWELRVATRRRRLSAVGVLMWSKSVGRICALIVTIRGSRNR
jgi:hypothetical protein